MVYTLLIIGFNLIVTYLISFNSVGIAIGWFFFAIGFQFGKWFGGEIREEEFITQQEDKL